MARANSHATSSPDWPAVLPAHRHGARDSAVAGRPARSLAWLKMLLAGTLAGALLALDNALDLDMTSVLYPVWQACVAVRLAMALRRGDLS